MVAPDRTTYDFVVHLSPSFWVWFSCAGNPFPHNKRESSQWEDSCRVRSSSKDVGRAYLPPPVEPVEQFVGQETCCPTVEPVERQYGENEQKRLSRLKADIPNADDFESNGRVLEKGNWDNIAEDFVLCVYVHRRMVGVECQRHLNSLSEDKNRHPSVIRSHNEVIGERAEPLQADAYKENGEELSEMLHVVPPVRIVQSTRTRVDRRLRGRIP